jgi:hypothetical protein
MANLELRRQKLYVVKEVPPSLRAAAGKKRWTRARSFKSMPLRYFIAKVFHRFRHTAEFRYCLETVYWNT